MGPFGGLFLGRSVPTVGPDLGSGQRSFHSMFQLLAYPGIETLARDGSRGRNVSMKVGTNPGNKLDRERLVRLLAALGTKRQVVINGILKGLAQLGHGRSLKCDNVPGIDDFAVKNLGLVIVFDVSDVALILHHGVKPASVKKRRKERKAPLSVSFWGWGRWNTARTLFRAMRTRDPLPSEISAPKAAPFCRRHLYAD